MGRTHVIIDDALLDEIDHVVGQRGRSKFLEQAAREKLEREGLIKAIHETAGLLAEHPPEYWRDRKATREWVRESRRGRR